MTNLTKTRPYPRTTVPPLPNHLTFCTNIPPPPVPYNLVTATIPIISLLVRVLCFCSIELNIKKRNDAWFNSMKSKRIEWNDTEKPLTTKNHHHSQHQPVTITSKTRPYHLNFQVYESSTVVLFLCFVLLQIKCVKRTKKRKQEPPNSLSTFPFFLFPTAYRFSFLLGFLNGSFAPYAQGNEKVKVVSGRERKRG